MGARDRIRLSAGDMTCPKCTTGELRYVLNEGRTQILGTACKACDWRDVKPESSTWSKPVEPGARWFYVVYDRPHDMPTKVVVRGYIMPRGEAAAYPTNWFRVYNNLEAARAELGQSDLHPVARDPSDDPKIIESWI